MVVQCNRFIKEDNLNLASISYGPELPCLSACLKRAHQSSVWIRGHHLCNQHYMVIIASEMGDITMMVVMLGMRIWEGAEDWGGRQLLLHWWTAGPLVVLVDRRLIRVTLARGKPLFFPFVRIRRWYSFFPIHLGFRWWWTWCRYYVDTDVDVRVFGGDSPGEGELVDLVSIW